MVDQYTRTRMIIGEEGLEKLKKSHVAIFGLGGVGSYAVEALARSGVGHLTLVDHDTFTLTNLNRQLYAVSSSIGKYKTDAAISRIRNEIDPSCQVEGRREFFLPDEEDRFPFSTYDYVIDAVDTVSAKIGLVMACAKAGTPLISSMGAGYRVHPEDLRVGDIYETSMDPLARVMRRELKKRGVKSLKVVYSLEKPLPLRGNTEEESRKRQIPGSMVFVPAAAGLILASQVIIDLIGG